MASRLCQEVTCGDGPPYIGSIAGMASIDLHSPFSRAECEQRLRERVSNRFASYGMVIGHVSPSSFWLEKRIGYRNSFATHLRGRLTDDDHGTRIHCRVGLHLFVLAIASFAGLMVSGSLIATAIFNPRIAYVPLMMLGCGAILFAVGRGAARGDKEYLIEFLCRGLNAHDVRDNPVKSV